MLKTLAADKQAKTVRGRGQHNGCVTTRGFMTIRGLTADPTVRQLRVFRASRGFKRFERLERLERFEPRALRLL
jgi:hypothetical protein